MGPVVSKHAMITILGYIDVGKKEGKLVHGGDRAPGDGYFVQPTIIADVDPKARISQEEIFGPVLAGRKTPGLHQPLQSATNNEFGVARGADSPNKGEI